MRESRPLALPQDLALISLERYTLLLSRPPLRSAMLASVLGRLPIGITGLAILLLGQAASGSFTLGGATAASYTAGLALVAPLLGRWIDRYGPRPVLLFCSVAFPCALVALVIALDGPRPWWMACAAALASGATFPPITVSLRTFFKQQLVDESLLAAAYSLESVVIEMIFILGPMLVALFVAAASPAAAVLFAASCGCIGTLLFLRSRALKHWRIEPRKSGELFGPLSEPGFPSLLAIVLCYAGAFGMVEIGATAFAAEHAWPAFAGVLLGVMSIGSAIGGLVYGSRRWQLPLERQFPITLALMGLGIAPLAALSSLWAFGAWCLAAGVAMAPSLIMQSMLVAKIARPEHSTEAFTWSTTALLTGVGLGLTAGGALLDRWNSPAVFSAAAALSATAGALAARRARRSSGERT